MRKATSILVALTSIMVIFSGCIGETENRAPTAKGAGPQSANVSTEVIFNASNSSDLDGDNLTYSWDFGDNMTGTGINPAHTYASAGNYTITLTVNDGHGHSSIDRFSIAVDTPPVNQTGTNTNTTNNQTSNNNQTTSQTQNNTTTNQTATNNTNTTNNQTQINSTVNASNQFALDFYSHVKSEGGNVFYSPYSISTAFSMVYEGARGETADEIQSVFHFQKNDTVRRTEVEAIYDSLNPSDAGYNISTANAMWILQGYQLLSEYIQTILNYYHGNATNLDFINAAEQARQTINSWVENKTAGRIKDLIPQGVLDGYTRLVLTNAIYFNATWVNKFDKSGTSNRSFWTNSSHNVTTPMMHQTASFNYAETDKLQILEMPYSGGNISMLVLLPKDNNLTYLENSLSLENLTIWENALQENEVSVTLPKFTIETKYNLKHELHDMGISLAFSNADFSGIDGTTNLFISAALHKAFVNVDENGTEAAAATAIVLSFSAVPSTVAFNADHPFIFIIQDRNNGNILFFGKVANPTQNS